MISELSIEDFTRLIVNKLEALNIEVVLQSPTSSSVFPCRVVKNPTINIKKEENTVPLYTRFTFSVEEWADEQYDCMNMSQETAVKLREYNISKINNDTSTYDQTANKYRIINNYEVNFNRINKFV